LENEIRIPNPEAVLGRHCQYCRELLAVQYLSGPACNTDEEGAAFLLCLPDGIGINICTNCLMRQPRDGRIMKQYFEFAERWKASRLQCDWDVSCKAIREAAKALVDAQHEEESPNLEDIIRSQPGLLGGLPMSGKQQSTLHLRSGKSVNKTYCDVKGENVDILVIDDEKVRIGCQHYSQGGFLEGPKGSCKLKSNLFVTRWCIFKDA